MQPQTLAQQCIEILAGCVTAQEFAKLPAELAIRVRPRMSRGAQLSIFGSYLHELYVYPYGLRLVNYRQKNGVWLRHGPTIQWYLLTSNIHTIVNYTDGNRDGYTVQKSDSGLYVLMTRYHHGQQHGISWKWHTDLHGHELRSAEEWRHGVLVRRDDFCPPII